ncbi:MAG: hypothetical protein JRI51_08655 [Deltaproteobacteria bacterium]|nr:hypothetical protein [Deltaproteobacteria bacterium]
MPRSFLRTDSAQSKLTTPQLAAGYLKSKERSKLQGIRPAEIKRVSMAMGYNGMLGNLGPFLR